MATMNATDRALDLLLRAAGDPLAELRDIRPGHPEFHRAQAIRAGAGVLSKTPDAFPAIQRAIAAAEYNAPADVQAHLAAAHAWVTGNAVLAAERYAAILSARPSDLLALRLAQSCYFFLGWHERLCSLVNDVMRDWPRGEEGFDFVLAMASFVHAECGDAGYAEALGRRALARDPACPLGVHSVAHAIAESGRPRHGAQWMRDQHAHWARESRMCTHNAWHLAMFDADAGNVEPALAILDAWLLPASAGSALEACDAAALVWRLESEGVDCAGRWDLVSDAFEHALRPGFWPFVDLHAALAHVSARKGDRVLRLNQAIEQCGQGNSYGAWRARHVTLPGVRAFGAWDRGRYDEAARLLAGLRPLLAAAGGSTVQLEVFKRVEQEARRRRPLVAQDADERAMPVVTGAAQIA
jgi:hypothetical protein